MENNKFLQSAALLIAGVFLGYVVATFFLSPSSSCLAPGNLRLTGKTTNSLTFSWDAQTDANYYTIEIRDSTKIGSIDRLLITQNNSITIDNLEPGRGYSIGVSTVCDVSQSQASISPAPRELGATTDFIIVTEIPPGITNPCYFNVCDTPVTVTGNCFAYGSSPANFQLEIKDAAGGVLARNLFRKTGLTSIEVHTTNNCKNGPQPANYAQKSATCTPGNRICGSFTDAGTTVNYTITFGITQCCVAFSSGTYGVEVRKCSDDSSILLREK